MASSKLEKGGRGSTLSLPRPTDLLSIECRAERSEMVTLHANRLKLSLDHSRPRSVRWPPSTPPGQTGPEPLHRVTKSSCSRSTPCRPVTSIVVHQSLAYRIVRPPQRGSWGGRANRRQSFARDHDGTAVSAASRSRASRSHLVPKSADAALMSSSRPPAASPAR